MVKRTRRDKNSLFVRLFGGVLFSLFSFVFLYCLQGDLLAKAQYVYSEGITRYSFFPGALIITLILLVFQWFVRSILPFRNSYYTLSYLPSCLILTIITSFNESVFEYFTFGSLAWIFPIVLCIYVFVVYFLNRITSVEYSNKKSKKEYPIWMNSIILLIMFIMVGSFANTNDVFTYELKTERLILDAKYKEAVDVGKKSLISSRRLTELRMFALANNGTLGDDMFDYPQYYGVDGLLDISDTLSKQHRVSPCTIFKSIGVYPKDKMDTRAYFELAYNIVDSICSRSLTEEPSQAEFIEDGDEVRISDSLEFVNIQMIKDYYCAYLLLDKNVEKLSAVFDTVKSTMLPKAVGEAILLVYESEMERQSQNGDIDISSIPILQKLYSRIDSVTVKRRAEYMEMRNNISISQERINKLRRNYGDTYWWYYEFSDSVTNPSYN